MALKSCRKKRTIGKQYKTYSFETKEISLNSQSRTISGYAAIFNNVDKSKDILLKGAFSKSISERGPESTANDKIIFLWMHDPHEPIGRITKLVEDDRGLYFEAVIDDIELGNRTIKQLESGTLNQFSIGYEYIWDKIEYDEEKDAYFVKEVILWELSVVSVGCNGLTEYTGLKSAEEIEDKFEKLQKEIDRELSGLSTSKKSAIQGLFSKVISLCEVKPDKENLKNPLDDQKAEAPKKSFFDGIVFKQINQQKQV